MQSRFEVKKRTILEQLNAPESEYHDLSPKGSVDEPIRSLIQDINRLNGLVTTSSCSGRVSVFLEGRKKHVDALKSPQNDTEAPANAGPGGKGGGSWLYISHEPIDLAQHTGDSDLISLFGVFKSSTHHGERPGPDSSYIHLKFEPMILHISTASLGHAQHVLTAALSAGFRESGAVSLSNNKAGDFNPMVAVRSTGYSFDAIIGFQDAFGENTALIDEAYLQTLASIANERFTINADRITRFRSALLDQFTSSPLEKSLSASKAPKTDWEDPEVRRQRKREEGLARQRNLIANLDAPGRMLPESVQSVNTSKEP